MLSFLYLAVLVYGAKSSLQPIKQDNGMHFNLKSVNNNTSKGFIADIMASPKQFVAQFANLDPVELQRIISLLEDLRTTSETREATLQDTLSQKIAEAVVTGSVVTDAEGALTDAQGVVDEKERELDDARAAHDTKVSERVAAKQEHDDEKPSLDDEQEVLTNVITMLGNLHSRQNPQVFTLQAWTAGGESADTINEVFVQFEVDSIWTTKVVFFTGATKNEMKEKDFSFPSFPSAVRFSIEGDDAWGYWKIEITKENGEVNTIAEYDGGSDGISYGDNKWWIDGNQEAPASNTFLIND